MENIILVEDDKILREELKIFLQKNGFNVQTPDNFETIVEYILENEPSLVLLDLNLPIYDGYHICRELRKKSNIPIIIVTSRNTDIDELIGINLGADDFITKPYNTQILLARIGALLKRSSLDNKKDNLLKYNDIELNLLNATIFYKGQNLELTKNEFKILCYLIENKGKIISRQDFIEYLWQTDFFVDDATLTVNITRLRKKLESIGIKDFIQTKRGLGYIVK